MAIEFVAAGTVAEDFTDGTTGLTVSVPAGVSEGDFMLMFSHRNDDDWDWSTLSGWTREADLDKIVLGGVGDGAARTTGVWWKIAGASEPGSYELNCDDSGDEEWTAVIVAYSGVDQSTPLDVTPVEANHLDIVVDDTSPTSGATNPAITTQTDGAFVILTFALTHSFLTTVTAPSNYNLRVGYIFGYGNLMLADREIASATTETPSNWQNANSSVGADGTMSTLALKPASGDFGQTINRVLTENTIVTDPVPGYILMQERPANSNVNQLTDAFFIIDSIGQLAADNLSSVDQWIMMKHLRRDILDCIYRRGNFLFVGGHDPEDFSTWVQSEPTVVTVNTHLDAYGQLTADTVADSLTTDFGYCLTSTFNAVPVSKYEDMTFSIHVRKDAIPASVRYPVFRCHFQQSAAQVDVAFDTMTGEIVTKESGDIHVRSIGFEDFPDYRRIYVTANDKQADTPSTTCWMLIGPALGKGNLADFNGIWDMTVTGSVVLCCAQINAGPLMPYGLPDSDTLVKDIVSVAKHRFQELSDAIAASDDFTKSITIGPIGGTTFTKLRKEAINLNDNVEAAFFGINAEQIIDGLLTEEAEFLQRFRARSIQDQISIITGLLNISHLRIRRTDRDFFRLTDNLTIDQIRIRDVTLSDYFKLVDSMEWQKTGTLRKRLKDAFDVLDSKWFESGTTLKPPVPIETGIEER